MKPSTISRESLDVTFMLTAPCNYHCYYCCARDARGSPVTDLTEGCAAGYLGFLDRFDAPVKIARLNAYGELTQLPGIWDFITQLARRARVMLATNLTFAEEDLYRALPPQAAWLVLTSLHPETERCIDGFVTRYQNLIRDGYPLAVHSMVDDGRIAVVERHRRWMQQAGIPFFISPVQGHRGNRRLPFDLAEETKRYLLGAVEELHPQLLVRYRELAFTGLACSAGYNRFVIRGMAVSPCMNSDRLLGWADGEFRPLPQPVPCAASHAESQCLPDLFLPHCRNYCMGDFRLPVSRDRLQADLARFAGLYEEVVKPALATLRSNALQRLSDSLPAGKERVSLALFGLPRWPYLAILQERMAIEALVAAEGETTGSIGALQVSTEQYKETFRPDVRLVVLSTVHAASAARSFVALLPAGHPQPLCMLDLPVQLPDTVSSHA